MLTADQVIALLRQASAETGHSRVCATYDTLMSELATQLVGEPLPDGEVSDAEWVLLSYSLRQLSRSPRSGAAWARIQRQAADLQSALKDAELEKAVAVAAPVQSPASASRRPSLRPAWLPTWGRSRTVAAPPVTISQSVGTIQNSQNVQMVANITPGGVLEVEDATEEDTAPSEPEDTATACDIFLSYSRRDAKLMRRVRADLRVGGFSVWTDESLKPGTPSWLDAIERAIRSSMCVIVLLSPDAKKSEWVEKELQAARLHRKQIIPLLARGDESLSMPMQINTMQYADIRSESLYKSRMRDLARILRNLQRGAKVSA
jgi:hypothetical protein